ncbi:hypothetical protein [Nonomuraea sp. SYSU D8015]|uniref:hypothetical protein n=1 Tax=Nonomuraea sp. SYSU D8015 TaxID=2593644 RepID=UPI00300D44B4
MPRVKLRRVPYPPDYVDLPLTPGCEVSGVVGFPLYGGYVVVRPRQFARKPAGSITCRPRRCRCRR